MNDEEAQGGRTETNLLTINNKILDFYKEIEDFFNNEEALLFSTTLCDTAQNSERFSNRIKGIISKFGLSELRSVTIPYLNAFNAASQFIIMKKWKELTPTQLLNFFINIAILTYNGFAFDTDSKKIQPLSVAIDVFSAICELSSIPTLTEFFNLFLSQKNEQWFSTLKDLFKGLHDPMLDIPQKEEELQTSSQRTVKRNTCWADFLIKCTAVMKRNTVFFNKSLNKDILSLIANLFQFNFPVLLNSRGTTQKNVFSSIFSLSRQQQEDHSENDEDDSSDNNIMINPNNCVDLAQTRKILKHYFQNPWSLCSKNEGNAIDFIEVQSFSKVVDAFINHCYHSFNTREEREEEEVQGTKNSERKQGTAEMRKNTEEIELDQEEDQAMTDISEKNKNNEFLAKLPITFLPQTKKPESFFVDALQILFFLQNFDEGSLEKRTFIDESSRKIFLEQMKRNYDKTLNFLVRITAKLSRRRFEDGGELPNQYYGLFSPKNRKGTIVSGINILFEHEKSWIDWKTKLKCDHSVFHVNSNESTSNSSSPIFSSFEFENIDQKGFQKFYFGRNNDPNTIVSDILTDRITMGSSILDKLWVDSKTKTIAHFCKENLFPIKKISIKKLWKILKKNKENSEEEKIEKEKEIIAENNENKPEKMEIDSEKEKSSENNDPKPVSKDATGQEKGTKKEAFTILGNRFFAFEDIDWDQFDSIAEFLLLRTLLSERFSELFQTKNDLEHTGIKKYLMKEMKKLVDGPQDAQKLKTPAPSTGSTTATTSLASKNDIIPPTEQEKTIADLKITTDDSKFVPSNSVEDANNLAAVPSTPVLSPNPDEDEAIKNSTMTTSVFEKQEAKQAGIQQDIENEAENYDIAVIPATQINENALLVVQQDTNELSGVNLDLSTISLATTCDDSKMEIDDENESEDASFISNPAAIPAPEEQQQQEDIGEKNENSTNFESEKIETETEKAIQNENETEKPNQNENETEKIIQNENETEKMEQDTNIITIVENTENNLQKIENSSEIETGNAEILEKDQENVQQQQQENAEGETPSPESKQEETDGSEMPITPQLENDEPDKAANDVKSPEPEKENQENPDKLEISDSSDNTAALDDVVDKEELQILPEGTTDVDKEEDISIIAETATIITSEPSKSQNEPNININVSKKQSILNKPSPDTEKILPTVTSPSTEKKSNYNEKKSSVEHNNNRRVSNGGNNYQQPSSKSNYSANYDSYRDTKDRKSPSTSGSHGNTSSLSTSSSSSSSSRSKGHGYSDGRSRSPGYSRSPHSPSSSSKHGNYYSSSSHSDSYKNKDSHHGKRKLEDPYDSRDPKRRKY